LTLLGVEAIEVFVCTLWLQVIMRWGL